MQGLPIRLAVKTAGPATEVGFDGGKLVLGRKRHIVVDTLGLLLGVFVHRDGLTKLDLSCFCNGWPITGRDCNCYGLTVVIGGLPLPSWVQQTTGLILQPVKRPQGQKGEEVLPRRWIVERTFSWFNHYRRLSKDYEFLPTKARDDDLCSHDSFDAKKLTQSKLPQAV